MSKVNRVQCDAVPRKYMYTQRKQHCTYTRGNQSGGMSEHLTEQDLERIEDFANTPRYKRSPDELLPSRDDDD